MAGRALSQCFALLPLVMALGCHARGAQDMKAALEVREALRTNGMAHVLVALEPPPGFGEPAADTERLAAAIAAVQDRVIAALDTADFRVRQQFRNVPALAGTVRTERGLAILSGHPAVVRIDLDLGGGGTR